MKIFGFNQKLACKYGLKSEHLLIFRWLVDTLTYTPTALEPVKVGDKIFHKFDYVDILIDYPILAKPDAEGTRLFVTGLILDLINTGLWETTQNLESIRITDQGLSFVSGVIL